MSGIRTGRRERSHGDLYLVGGGDPLLSSDWYPTSNMERYPVMSPTRLEALADELVSAGVTSITGDVVGDASRYDDEYFAPTWGAGVAGLEAGPYDALMANDSRVLFEPLKSNDPAHGAAQEFVRMLDERGIAVGGTAIDRRRPEHGGRTRRDPVGTAHRHRRRDARQQRQQHRRAARQGTRLRRQWQPAHARPGSP